MKKTNCLFTLWVAALCAGTHAYAVGTAPAILSNYGEIQSVKNYSSNPFWNKNSPYNQNFPKPIYATGADLNTGDCNRVVENLVTSYCAEHNYCRNLRISDVRPTIMVQLSQLPGHNFATSCGGYIDSAFDKFQKEYGNVSTVNLPKPASQPTNIEIANPFAPKQTAAQKAVADRTTELERLQSITTPTAGVHAEYFPKTTADLSFTDRIANTTAGLEQYKDMPSYKKPNFLGEDEAFFERLKNQNFEEYCNRRPTDPECKDWYCKKHPDDDKCKKKTEPETKPEKPVKPGVQNECTQSDRHLENGICVCNNTLLDITNDCCPRHAIRNANGECECTVPGSLMNPFGNACMCNNGGSINDNCGHTPRGTAIPQCLIKMYQDNDFNTLISNKLNTSTSINLQELQNKQVLSDIAQNVYKFCIDSDTAPATDFAEFNTFLDTEEHIPISIKINNQTTTVNINAEELFEYTDYSFDIIAIQKNNFQLQSTIKRDDVTYLPKRETCALYYGPAPVTDCISVVMFGKTPSITSAAKEVYGDHIYNLNKSLVWAFPGNLVYGKNGSCQATIVRMRNYKIARQKIKALAASLKSASGCSGLGMVLYLVNPKSASLNNNRITEVIIKSEPFFIP